MTKQQLINECKKAIKYQKGCRARDESPLEKEYDLGKIIAYTEMLSLIENLD